MMLRSLHAMEDVFVVVAVLVDVGGRGQIAAYQRMCTDGRKPTAIVIPTNGRIPTDVYRRPYTDGYADGSIHMVVNRRPYTDNRILVAVI